MRGDLIEVFKMLKGFVNVDVNDYFTLAQSRITRGNGYKIASKRFASQEAKHFFNCVVNAWNMINEVEVGCQLGNSDHREIRFNLEWEVSRDDNLVLVPDYRRANYEKA